jgi:purine-binding chemotaxis protein CheW
MSGATTGPQALVCRVGVSACALPLANVVETMRPLPIEPLPGVAPFVLGLSVIRGSAVPVVDARVLLGLEAVEPSARYVVLSLGARRAALAVSSVVGVRRLDLTALGELPPLAGAVAADLIAAVATLDAGLLLVLRAARVVPEAAWAAARLRG